MIIEVCCVFCKHIDKGEKMFCKAFPNGIPEEVMFREIEHDKVLDGQVGDFIYEEYEEFFKFD